MVHLVTEIEFVEGDDVSDDHVQGYEKHLAETIQKAAQELSLRTIGNTQVGAVLVAEIRG
jgi:hypothetical protein